MVPTLVVQGRHHIFFPDVEPIQMIMTTACVGACIWCIICDTGLYDWYGATTRRSKTKSRPQPSPGAIAWFFIFPRDVVLKCHSYSVSGLGPGHPANTCWLFPKLRIEHENTEDPSHSHSVEQSGWQSGLSDALQISNQVRQAVRHKMHKHR